MVQVIIYFSVLLLVAKPLGGYMAAIYEGRLPGFARFLSPLEKAAYKIGGIHPEEEMTWKGYALAFLAFNLAGFLALYAMLRLQAFLPANPQDMAGMAPETAFNTAVSFVSNTNWQAYGGESTLSYFSQMAGLSVQNFISAAVGLSVAIALIRGFCRHQTDRVGNFWADTVRGVVYILLPLSFVLAVVLVSQGVVQTFSAYVTAKTLQGADQIIALGPAASQIAIKQLGTNGGGFFNVNAAHPFENPTPLSNFLEMLAILLIPAALCHTFGAMVKDKRQGWAVLATMTLILVSLLALCGFAEQRGNPAVNAILGQAAPNMEGKELRFGIANSVLWATVTTAASNGSVNAMHDSFTPLGGFAPLWLIQLGEIIFGGVGSGLYGMIVFALVAVFIAGLMVGRTPEYLGKKIEAFEMKMASIVILIPALTVKFGTAIAVTTEAGGSAIANPGAHGFSEILYAFSSAANNNGSAFGGLGVNTVFYNVALGLCMLLGRYWVAIPVLAVAGALAAKKKIPASSGTLPTHTPLFVGLLIAVIVIVGSLTFLPSLALGPVVEHMQLFGM